MIVELLLLSCLFADLTSSATTGHNCGNHCPTEDESERESVITFSVFFSITVIAAIVVFVFQRRVIGPIILEHAARANDTDFSVVQNFTKYFNILERVKSEAYGNENILWADVSLIIAPLSHFLLVLGSFVIAYILMGVTANSKAQLALVPLFLIILFGGFTYVAIGLKQVIGKHHFKDIYVLTDNKIVIINYSRLNCRKPSTEHIAYQDLYDIKLTYNGDVGTISFHTRFGDVRKSAANKPKSTSLSLQDPTYREFRNIVNPRGVEVLLVNRCSNQGKGKQMSEDGYQEVDV